MRFIINISKKLGIIFRSISKLINGFNNNNVINIGINKLLYYRVADLSIMNNWLICRVLRRAVVN